MSRRASFPDMAKPPEKKLRWGRLIGALVVLGAGVGAIIYLVTQ